MPGTVINDDVFLANAKFSYAPDAITPAEAAGEYIKIHGMQDVGPLGLTDEAKEKTNMEDTQKTYGSGLADAPDKELKGNLIPFQGTTGPYQDEYSAQQAFIAYCLTRKQMMIQVEYADGEIDEFLFKPLGYQTTAPSSSEWKSFSVPGKQNSKIFTTKPTV